MKRRKIKETNILCSKETVMFITRDGILVGKVFNGFNHHSRELADVPQDIIEDDVGIRLFISKLAQKQKPSLVARPRKGHPRTFDLERFSLTS